MLEEHKLIPNQSLLLVAGAALPSSLARASANIPHVKAIAQGGLAHAAHLTADLNVYDILHQRNIVLSRAALSHWERILARPARWAPRRPPRPNATR